MNTKNISIPENRRSGDAPGLPPGPASAKPAEPKKQFASVINQAMKRKSSDLRSADVRSDLRSAESRSAHVRATKSSASARRAEAASPDTAPARAGRVSNHSTDKHSTETGAANNRGAVEGGSRSAMERPVERIVPEDGAEELSDAVDLELNTPEMLEEEIEENTADVPSNIIAFPGMAVAQSVIIPFPLAAAKAMSSVYGASGGSESNDGAGMGAGGGSPDVAEGNILQLPNANMPKASGVAASEQSSATGIDISKLGMELVKQVQSETKLSSAIAEEDVSQPETVALAFGKEVSSKSDSLVASILESATARESEDSGEQAESQLPDESGLQEETAGHDEGSAPLAKDVSSRSEVGKGPVHAGLASFRNVAAAAGGSAGIGAARQESRMESLPNSERVSASGQGAFEALEEFQPMASEALPDNGAVKDLSARNLVATEWQMGRPVSSVDRSAPNSVEATPVNVAATVERISKLLMVETALVRKHGSDAMAVVLRPDSETELFVHFTQRNGQVEASIRCERGDAQHLNALWPQLQESLALQKVRLAPLQESSSNQSNFNQPNGSGQGGGENRSSRQSPQDERFMDERPEPASSETSAHHVRGNGGSGHRRVTTSRPGWETWA